MALGRIGTYAVFQSTIKDMSNAQNELIRLQTQISSGLKSQNYAGIADQTEQFLDLENKISKTDLYIKNNRVVKTRLEVTSTSLDQIVETANSLKNLIATRRSGTQGELSTFRAQLTDMWQTIAAQLNVSSEGRYLFSGTSTDVKPVDANQFPRLSTLGVPDDGYYSGSNEDIIIRAQEDIEFTYNIRADNPAFQKIIAGLSTALEGDEGSSDVNLAAAYDFVDEGLRDVITLQASVNANKVAIDEIDSQHQSFKLYWQGVKEDIGNTDLVAASTQVALNQGILQAAFQAYARINSLRLSDFLQ
ncbi:MAG: hypothetical protein ACK502_00645 [Alphaproteobacteria bacterium]